MKFFFNNLRLNSPFAVALLRRTGAAVPIILFIFAIPVFADITPWADVWTNGAYYSTNGENSNFRAVQLRSEGRFGFNFGESSPTKPYIVYYGSYGQDPNYWNNNLAVGGGVRSMPFVSFETTSWALEWIRDTKIYAEILTLNFLKGKATAEANGVKTNDYRIGIDIWHEWNLQNAKAKAPWAEMWTRIDYRNTNFYDPMSGLDKFQNFLGYFQLKIGRHLPGGVRPYLASYLTISGLKKVWLNNLYYGAGIRMEPFRDQENSPELLRKFKMYIEGLNISYLAELDPTRPVTDMRFGIEFTYGR
ncbi:hypothetical protein HZC34_03045 [Candidatus Saganbacteria bacterium]|nr:hypothetical protein [Candidatus Saganbacteria bacterium]